MPTYSYECAKCGGVSDVFHGMSETPKVKCGSCGSTRTKKLLGTGAGFIFKGSGFYETDFKEKKGTPPKSEGDSGSAGSTETKTESKPETKPDSKPAEKKEKKPAARKDSAKKAS